MAKFFVCLVFFVVYIFGADLKYSLIKKGDGDNTLLVIGGIQGDEPGGFFAANLLATEYNITKGSLWVVPNLNFSSIVKNNRGIRGDMNRKFAKILNSDPDYQTVSNIKDIITSPNVAMIVHLHDGSGFYRPWYINTLENPRRWGNCVVIDQDNIQDVKYGNLKQNSQQVIEGINQNLKDKQHIYHIKNTHTAANDTQNLEQRNSLTYFAITNGKAAYANEASKNIDVFTRVYYHLLALEEYMKIVSIEFTRNFELTRKGIKSVVEKEIQVNIIGNNFLLALDNPREIIKYIPTQKNSTLHEEYESSNPLLALIEDEKNTNNTSVYYGNKLLTKLQPQYFEYSQNSLGANVKIDGAEEIVIFGSKIQAKDSIQVMQKEGVRVNIIGFEDKKHKNEAGILVKKSDIKKEFSLDKNGRIFRVEFYEPQTNGKKDKYLGMFLVEFIATK